jgi:hypothetical protein
MNKETDDINQLYGESAAGIHIEPAETNEDHIRQADGASVLDSYFSRGGENATERQAVKQGIAPTAAVIQEKTEFLTEGQMVNHHLEAAIANIQKVAPLFESADTQYYFGEIVEAIKEMKQ